jgi:dihydrofolate reductase
LTRAIVVLHGDPTSRKPARELAIIVAVAANGVIGDGIALPWRLPDDLKRFRQLTTGHSIIMGRRTWQSLPRALPDRQNIVVSRNAALVAEGAQIAHSLADAVALAELPAPVFVIGGATLIAEALPAASTFYLTEIHAEYPGDVHFPAWDRGRWREAARDDHAAADDLPAYSYLTLVRAPAITMAAHGCADLR